MVLVKKLAAPLGLVQVSGGRPCRCGRLEAALAALTILLSTVFSAVYLLVWCRLDLAPDEAHYWDWSRHLDWSYYSKGPLVAWLIRAGCELFGSLSIRLSGDLAAAVRLPAVICHAATLVAWYVLAAGVFRSPRLGLAVVVLASVLPVVRIGSVLMTIDPPFLAAWSWALVCVWRAVTGGRSSWWVGAAICCAVGILAKYTMAIFPLMLVAYLLVHKREEFRRGGIWLILSGMVIGFLPILIWNASHDWVSFRHVFGQIGVGGPGRFRWLGPVSFLGGQAGMMFGLWLAAFLAAAWRFRPAREPDSGIRLLWWCSVPVWGLFAAASFVKNGQPNWPAPAYVGGFVLAVAWVREPLAGPNRRLAGWCLGVNVALGLIVLVGLHYPPPFRQLLARIAGPPTERDPAPIRKLDVTARLTGWRTVAAEVDRLRDRIAKETGREAVIAGTYWNVPGQLGFWCSGRPDVYSVGIPNRSDRHSQYDFWRPNPVADAQVFRGRPFVIVGEIGPHMLAAFDRVELPIRLVHTENGIPIEVWTIWVCRGFRGFPHGGADDHGY